MKLNDAEKQWIKDNRKYGPAKLEQALLLEYILDQQQYGTISASMILLCSVDLGEEVRKAYYDL